MIRQIDPWRSPSVSLRDRHLLPATPGLYFAIKGEVLLYVGMSKNLNKRWTGSRHHELDNLMRVGGVRLHYKTLVGWTEKQIKDLELGLIRRYTPRFNEVGVTNRNPANARRREQGGWLVCLLAVVLMLAIAHRIDSVFKDAVDGLIEDGRSLTTEGEGDRP